MSMQPNTCNQVLNILMNKIYLASIECLLSSQYLGQSKETNTNKIIYIEKWKEKFHFQTYLEILKIHQISGLWL